jgi:hypothetical protein
MQVCYQGHARNNMEMIFPQYPTKLFSIMAQLLDLVTLDEGTLRYSYGVIAAACIYVVCSKFHALNASGMHSLYLQLLFEILRRDQKLIFFTQNKFLQILIS